MECNALDRHSRAKRRGCLEATLDHLDVLRLHGAIEVIVAACDDVERTKTAVSNRAILIWSDDSTRAALMNTGAAVAHGDVLLFLHAIPCPH